MALWDRVTALIATKPVLTEKPRYSVETRAIDSFTDYPGLEEQLLRVQGLSPRPWKAAGLRDALGVPSVFGAVTLISNMVGSLTMRALRNEVELLPEDRPRVIVRPDPFTIPREFYRQTAYNMATRGEAWWWIARRDIDGNALSVLNINPAEITITENKDDLLRPEIRWRNKKMPNEDIRQLVYQREPGSLRGIGPLQVCQAAISVTVEAQEWAANFYADGGGVPTIIKSAVELGEDPNDPDGLTEAERLMLEWSNKGNNRPRVIDPRIEGVEQFDYNPQGAQMLDARMYQNGETARMFNMPGTLVEYAMSGSSLTYQNLSTVFEDFLRRCLRPNYLRPIEETMSDLLPRSTVARFDTDILTLADPKTRYETYTLGIAAGILTAEQAQSFEGITPGDTDNAPVPFAPPQAIPDALPIQGRSEAGEIRCRKCNRLLAERAAAPYRFTCKCKTVNEAAEPIEPRSEPSVVVNPTIVAPAQPAMTVNIEQPKTAEQVDRLASHVEAMAAHLLDVSGNVAMLADKDDSIEERLATVASQQALLREKLDVPVKPKTFHFDRDDRGVIVKASEVNIEAA